MDFILSNNIIYPKQYGFLHGRSTEHAITDVLLDLIEGIENKTFPLAVFLDLTKAFDSISHTILIRKMYRYGIRGTALDWFKSYLTNRAQFVQIDLERSSNKSIDFGVPQGSVLGPILFLLYINDLPSCSDILSFTLFADDTTALYNSSSLDDAFQTVNNELDHLNSWMSSNNLAVNVSKTNFVLFMTRQKFLKTTFNDHHYLTMSSKPVLQKDGVKFLGLLIDNNLTFNNHINHICSKLLIGIYALRRASKVLASNDLKTLYSSLILPYLNYNLLAWGGACKLQTKYKILNQGENSNPMKNLTKLHKLQKRALRIVAKASYHSHHIPLCHDLKLPDLPDLYNVKSLVFFYDFYHGNLPPTLSHIFSFRSGRNNELFIKISHRRTDIASSSLVHTLPEIWNCLPFELKLEIIKSKKTFINKVKTHYISKYKEWSCTTFDCYSCKQSLI